MVEFFGKIWAVLGFGSIGAMVGAVIGGGAAAILSLVIAGLPMMEWYNAQPPEWWIVTFPIALVIVVVVVAIATVVGAVAVGLGVGAVIALISGAWLAGKD